MIHLSHSTKITLLFLSWRDIKSPHKGGAEVFTHEMLKRLNLDKFRIVHVSTEFEHCHKEELIDGIHYIRHGNNLSVIKFAKSFYRENHENIDFVVDQCNTHRFFTRFWVEPKKRIFFIHQLTREIWFKNSSFPVNLVGYLTESPFLRLSNKDHTITVSNSTKKDLLKLNFKPELVTILPEGINFKHWNTESFLEKENEPTFIYVGRFSKYKGIDDTVSAFCRLKKDYPGAKLWIVGKKKDEYIKTVLAPIMDKYEVSYGKPGERNDITFWGFVSDAKKLELMSRSHALIFPSLREGWGLIVTEAAAVGTPSITYNSPGIVDAINFGKAGYMCSSNTVDSIVSKMKSVIEDKGEYDALRKSSYDFSLNFHWDNTAKSFNHFINNII